VDFWASWCGPCLLQSPYLVNAYTKFHPKGFEIIGVSLDKKEDKEKWLGAIHFNHLAWTQVSDLNYFQNAVAKEYGINFIPQNFLIDPQGKIVARDLNNDDLENKLKEIYKD
jgi:thiol-disulfide isomerase/thioredoxin